MAIGSHAFPTFCGAIVGCYTLLQIPIRQACKQILSLITQRDLGSPGLIAGRRRVSRAVAAFVSAWLCLPLLNSPQHHRSGQKGNGDPPARKADPHNNASQSPSSTAGPSIDLTLFTVVRAIDATITTTWRHPHRKQIIPTYRLIQTLSSQADTLLFALSSGTIMWTWFYHPARLPHEYNKYIGEVAQVDPRLIEALRRARNGDFVYGQDRGPKARMLLQGMCKEYGWPVEWGDPERTVPIPCEMVHMGAGPSCHWHAGIRFMRTFRVALATNLPLQLVAKGFSRRRMDARVVGQAIRDAARSSVFLGAFGGVYIMWVVDSAGSAKEETGAGDVCGTSSIGYAIAEGV
ncbi:MAG: hypothetical protein OHK93_003172 [Ramalina farinacea]|uniref:Integral membrane protein n=1 Tax=Ramalina farinacea TaxID=258253 RepID=A0AA43QSR2_9LECA|nr:hypothetical protein [Ramalina farinacea]